MSMKLWRNGNNTVFLSLLSLMTAWNVSQAVVLCVGHDGHVAIEPLGHVHHGETHADDCHCCPCTDIPIPAGVCTARPAVTASETEPDESGALPPLQIAPRSAPDRTATCASPAVPAGATLVRTIVLQV
jgi:hypothetical protein